MRERNQVMASYLYRALCVFRRAGHTTESIAHNIHIDPNALGQPGVSITPAQYLTLLDLMIRASDDSAFGFHVGLEEQPLDGGVLGYACMSAPDLRRVLQLKQRFSTLINDKVFQPDHIEITEKEIVISTITQTLNDKHRTFFTLEWLGVLLTTLVSIFGETLKDYVLGIELTEKDRTIADVVGAVVACPVKLNAPKSQLRLSLEAGDLNNPNANPTVCKMCTEWCETIQSDWMHKASYIERVMHLVANHPQVTTDEATVAHWLNVSERRLRRELEREGRDFSEIRDSELHKTACDFLINTRLKIKEIAYQLGYSEDTSFCRAFRRWANMTPSEYRKQEKY